MERLDIYRQYAEELVRRGDAYYCYCTNEELEIRKEEQLNNGVKAYKYDRKCFYSRISVNELFDHYKNYCNDCNLTPISKVKFIRSVKEYDAMKDFFVYYYKSHGCMSFIVNRSAYKTNVVCEFDEDYSANETDWN